MNDPSFAKYLTYSPQDIRWKLYCTNTGHSYTPPGASYPPHPESHPARYSCNWDKGRILDEFDIVYITNGNGSFVSRGETHSIKPGSVFFLFPGVKHWYSPSKETGWDDYWVGFKGKYAEALYKEGFINEEDPVLQIGLHDTLIRHFTNIFELARKESAGYHMKISAQIVMLLAEILSLQKQQSQPSRSELIIDKARLIFEENVFGNISIEEVAVRLQTGTAHFRELFRDYTGMSPYQYYLHLKINIAKELLSTCEHSVKEIAFMLKFDDQYHFSKLFKKKTGVPPSRWAGTRAGCEG